MSKPRTNVILFGETGVGKSSIVNMLCPPDKGPQVGNGALGCTFENSSYDIDIFGQPVTLWDTAGLDEGESGRVANPVAVVKLYKLLLDISSRGGVSLLMLVMRSPRIRSSVPQNWRLFHEVICRSKVPIVIVVTGLEQKQPNMDSWWVENKQAFEGYGLKSVECACITATRGKALPKRGQHVFDSEYRISQARLQQLIQKRSLSTPWIASAVEWFSTSSRGRWANFWGSAMTDIVKQLQKECGMSQGDAEALAHALNAQK